MDRLALLALARDALSGAGSAFVGPCPHGRDPYTRCDRCGNLQAAEAYALAVADPLARGVLDLAERLQAAEAGAAAMRTALESAALHRELADKHGPDFDRCDVCGGEWLSGIECDDHGSGCALADSTGAALLDRQRRLVEALRPLAGTVSDLLSDEDYVLRGAGVARHAAALLAEIDAERHVVDEPSPKVTVLAPR